MPSTARTGELSIVIATCNRATTLLESLGKLVLLPQRPPIVVVDNGSSDATIEAVRRAHPGVRTIALGRNIGAAARSVGARAVDTPYVAFCDDDCWWAPGSLRRAAALLDAYSEVAVLNARVLVGDEERLDEACRAMALSDLPKVTECPGRPIGAFMAGAAVVRREAFLAAGGYHRRYHIGAEESLLALDLLAAGWQLVYDPELVLHHHPSAAARDPFERRRLVLRNRLWTKWLRHSAGCGLAST
ncbi:MAG: glycosyltransferase, partial [Candidatus Eremiobacteraeota bacterium]|nr:glycosyltransferase [Candidatus Eremiobacteraeota bacterium]